MKSVMFRLMRLKMKASTSVPAEAVSLYNKALDCSGKGDNRAALEYYKKAIEAYPEFVEAFSNLGEIYSKLGERTSALKAYADALSIQRNSRVLLNLGVEYYNIGNIETALPLFIESVNSDPSFIEGHFYSALAYSRTKNSASAELHLKKVIELDYKHLKANYLLSSILYDKKDYQSVLLCLEWIKDIAEDKAFVKKYYGFFMYLLGNYNEAVDALSEALRFSPEYSKFKDYLKSMTYESKIKEIGDISVKISELEKKMMKGDTSLCDFTKLSMLYIFNGENKKAEELLLPLKERYRKAS